MNTIVEVQNITKVYGINNESCDSFYREKSSILGNLEK
jgi:hypothetical protein